VRVEGQLTFNGTFQMLNAALGGFGLAYVPEDLAQPYLAKGRLKRVIGVNPPRPSLCLSMRCGTGANVVSLSERREASLNVGRQCAGS
jgi:DNA-binding transcriptional LysR family regulator